METADGSQQSLQEDVERLGRDVFSAHGMVEGLKAAIASFRDHLAQMTGHKPSDRYVDPDAPLLGDKDIDRLVRMALKYGGQGNGSVNGPSKLVSILVAINTALLIGVGGWLLVTVQRHDKELGVIECQLSPACAQAVTRGRP
jgi:hypothetical protein